MILFGMPQIIQYILFYTVQSPSSKFFPFQVDLVINVTSKRNKILAILLCYLQDNFMELNFDISIFFLSYAFLRSSPCKRGCPHTSISWHLCCEVDPVIKNKPEVMDFTLYIVAAGWLHSINLAHIFTWLTKSTKVSYVQMFNTVPFKLVTYHLTNRIV